MNKKEWAKKIGIGLIVIVGLYLYARCLYHLSIRTNMDADYSYVLMEANDIIHGNFFLNGWYQTGVSFLLTDMPFFMVGAGIFGLKRLGYDAAVMLMMAGALGSSYLLLEKKKEIRYTILFLAIAAIPALDAVDMQRSHIGGYIWSFLMFAAVMRAIKKGKADVCSIIAVVACTATCTMSDMASLVFGSASVLVVALFQIFFQKKADKKLYGTYILTVVAGVILGYVMDKLYYIIGTANKNEFIGNKSFIHVDAIPEHFYLYIKSLFVLGGGDFWGQGIFEVGTIVSVFYGILVVFGVVLIVRNIVLFLQLKNEDMISVFLSVGLAMVSVLFIFTDISNEVYASRYFGTFPYILAVVICRYFATSGIEDKNVYTCTFLKWKQIVIFITICSCIACGLRYRESMEIGEFTSSSLRLAKYLQEQGLKNGYGNFFDSSVVTVATDGAVTLRQIVLVGDDHIYPYYWFTKEEWYEKEAHFIIVSENPDDEFELNPTFARKCLGEPQKILQFEDYIIFVYDKDISTYVKFENWND